MKKRYTLIGLMLTLLIQCNLATEHTSSSDYFLGLLQTGNSVSSHVINIPEAKLIRVEILLSLSMSGYIDYDYEDFNAYLSCSVAGEEYTDFIRATADYPSAASESFRLYIPNNSTLSFTFSGVPAHDDYEGYFEVFYQEVSDNYIHSGSAYWLFDKDPDVTSLVSEGSIQMVVGNKNNNPVNNESFNVKQGDATGPVLMCVQENGDVGIGNAPALPQAKLHVRGTTRFDGPISFGHLKQYRHVEVSANDLTAYQDEAYTDLKINDRSSANTLLNSNGSGYVGIGTNAPQAKLHVWGSTELGGNTIIGKSPYRHYAFEANKITAYNGSEFYDIKLNANESTSNTLINFDGPGKVGIGTNTPDAKLHVKGTSKFEGDVYNTGTIRSTEVIIEMPNSSWPDFVFSDNYNLLDLSEVEMHIKENGHLPDVPSASQVAENGVSVGEMNQLLLKKIEELTLYMIEQQKEIDQLKENMK